MTRGCAPSSRPWASTTSSTRSSCRQVCVFYTLQTDPVLRVCCRGVCCAHRMYHTLQTDPVCAVEVFALEVCACAASPLAEGLKQPPVAAFTHPARCTHTQRSAPRSRAPSFLRPPCRSWASARQSACTSATTGATTCGAAGAPPLKATWQFGGIRVAPVVSAHSLLAAMLFFGIIVDLCKRLTPRRSPPPQGRRRDRVAVGQRRAHV